MPWKALVGDACKAFTLLRYELINEAAKVR